MHGRTTAATVEGQYSIATFLNEQAAREIYSSPLRCASSLIRSR